MIHVGFAMSKIDEDEAERALEGLQLMGQAYTDEVDAAPGLADREKSNHENRRMTPWEP